MRIQHNVMAMNAYRNYTNNVSAMKKNLEKLSSGYKINRAGDDAAGLAISEKMRAQITGLETAQKNAKDGISLVQTAEGALTEVHDMLNRMVELATQSANGTYDNDTDRFQLQKEMDQLRTEINRIADSANFNGIKLFDGSLSGADITATGIETSQIDMAKGVEVVQGSNGGGSKGEYTINLDAAFGTGDSVAITFGGKTGAGAADAAGTAGVVTLTYGTDFTGDTIEDQVNSIVKALKKDANVLKNFDVTADGTSVKLTAKVEGKKISGAGDDITSTVTDVTVTDKVTPPITAAGAGQADAAGKITVEKLIDDGTGTGMDITDGDEIQIGFVLNDGTELTTTLVAGKDFTVGPKTKDTLANLKDALNTAKLDANPDTIFDDAKLSFGDLFTVAVANDTDLEFTTKDGAINTADGKLTITNKTSGKTGPASDETTAMPAGAAASKTTVKLTTGASDSTNLSIGDKMTFEGKLADGRTFSITAEVGKDFKAGATYKATVENLKALLESDKFEVTLSDGSKVAGSDIFGDDAEIKIDAGKTTATDLVFESTRKGTHTASMITKAEITPGQATAVTPNLKNGEQQSSADSTITLSDGLSYGAVVEVDGKKYELVKAAGDVSNANNKAVIVDDISDLNSAAKALAEAIKGDLNAADYKVTASNNKVTIATTKVGSTATAIDASSSGDKTTQIEFTLDPKKMQAGSTVTINGQTYEFVDKGGKPTDKANQTIEVADFSKETAASLGSALAKAANGQKNASVTVDGDGKVTVRGLVDGETNEIVTPSVKFDGGKSGLRLQIGDTAEDFNQMTVSIYNMHCADMGIGNISIADQDSAAVAIDAIKSAINYVSDVRGTLGATQNRLDHTINNLSVMTENIQDAESTIRDTDVAAEMMAYTKNNILIQSAQAMLAQANQVPQGVLQLLQ